MKKNPKSYDNNKNSSKNKFSNNKITLEVKSEFSSSKPLIKNLGFLSKAGSEMRSPKKNQDNYLIIQKINNLINFNVFAVFDGHGVFGDQISDFVAKYFNETFLNNQKIKSLQKEEEIYKFLKENNFNFLQNIFNEAERQLIINKLEAKYSGTTCVMVIQIGYHIICCNVGDSRSILVKKGNKIEQLSFDHKPNIPKEKERIISHGGVVSNSLEPNVPVGIYRIWKKNEDYPGIAMSRSIGDLVATTIGVIPDPEIIEKNISDSFKFIILASDGVWEFLNNEKVTGIINKYYDKKDPKGACENLINESSVLWEKENENYIDDITAIILFF